MIEVYLVDENRGNCLRYPSIPNYPVTVWVKFIRIGYKQLPKGLVYVFRTIWKYKKKKTLVWVTGISLFSIFNRMGPARAGVIKDWFREYFKVFTKLPESRSDQGNLENFENTSEITSDYLRLQAITCLSNTGQNYWGNPIHARRKPVQCRDIWESTERTNQFNEHFILKLRQRNWQVFILF